jgi:hypothetical protein
MCKKGRRAAKAEAVLRQAGFTHVCNIGGITVEPLRSMLGGLRREGEPTPLEYARFGLSQSAVCYGRWLASRGGPPNFNALIGAYRHAYGAEMNYRDAGVEGGDHDGWGWRRAGELRQSHARELERVMGRCPTPHGPVPPA